jgi:hypothetical protein
MWLAREKPLLVFFALAYLTAWLAWAPLVLSRTGLGVLAFDLPLEYTIPGTCAPLVAALITQWMSRGNLRICRLTISWKHGDSSLVHR